MIRSRRRPIDAEHPLVIWNPSSGNASVAQDVRRRLSREYRCQVLETASRDEAIEVTREAAELGCRRVIAAGGDGTVSAVLQALADHAAIAPTECALAVLPLGTGNDLSRSLGMPLNPLDALPHLFAESTVQANILRYSNATTSRVVANMCTAGNTGVYLRSLTPEIKERWGPFCYLRGVVKVLTDLQAFDMTVRFDAEEPRTFSALNVFAANGRTTGAGLTIAPRARFDDGLMDVVIVLEGTVTELASLTTEYVFSDFLEHSLVVSRQVRSLEIAATPTMPVTIDGDSVSDAPFKVQVEETQVALVVAGVELSGGGRLGSGLRGH